MPLPRRRSRFSATRENGMTCRIVEEYGNERVAEALAERNAEFVESLLQDGSLSVEDIAAIVKVPLERVKQMAERLAAPAQA